MKKSVGVVLGGGVTQDGKPNAYTIERLKIAKRLFDENKVDCLILTGKGRHPHHNEAQSMHGWLIQHGVKNDALHLETQSHNTYENAFNTHLQYLRHMAIDNAYVVTNAFHMERAMVIFNGVSDGAYSVVAAPAADIDRNDIRAWKEKKGTEFYRQFFSEVNARQSFPLRHRR